MSLDFIDSKNKKIHFIGIGGISMSALAEILLTKGYMVSGSDSKESNLTEKLKSMGATIYIGQNSSNVENADIVVYTAAISADNPELVRATELNLTMYTRAEFLGEIMKNHKYNIAISGTNGKTTTTSMISHIALSANLDPTILVGGELDAINGNILVGKSDYFITEACEYKESFLQFFPYIGIILNINEDHLDYYKDINHIKEAFSKFINLIPEDGYLIANAEDPNLADIMNKKDFNPKCNIVTFGINKGRITARDITFSETSCAIFNVYDEDKKLFHIELNVPGEHNILNALSSIASYLCLNIPKEFIIDGLYNYRGTRRRFEVKGVKNGVTVIDDYAHNPTKISAAVKTVLNYPHKNIYCIFMPHTYTRTYNLFNEFCTCFKGLDNLIITDIFPAREKDTGIVSSKQLEEGIEKAGTNCTYMKDFKDIENYLHEHCSEGDVILTLGAGDAYKIGDNFLKNN